jgi:hypothetical protein
MAVIVKLVKLNIEILYRRLGYIGINRIPRAIKAVLSIKIEGKVYINDFFYELYTITKLKKLILRAILTRATVLYKRIYINTIKFKLVSTGGVRYRVFFVNDCTTYLYVCYLITKDGY